MRSSHVSINSPNSQFITLHSFLFLLTPLVPITLFEHGPLISSHLGPNYYLKSNCLFENIHICNFPRTCSLSLANSSRSKSFPIGILSISLHVFFASTTPSTTCAKQPLSHELRGAPHSFIFILRFLWASRAQRPLLSKSFLSNSPDSILT